MNKSQLAPSSERFDKSGHSHKNAYNSGTVGATSKCRTYLESWEQMQFNDTRKTVVAFVVLPEFAFKVRRFFRDLVLVNLLKPIIDGATCDVEKWP